LQILALSALQIREGTGTRGVAPGYYISRLWRSENCARGTRSIALRLYLKSVAILFLVVGSVLAQERPPVESGPFRQPELVEIVKLDPTIRLDIRYATRNNFLGKKVYKQQRAFLQRPAAEALARANQKLRAQGYGIVVFDGYRPWAVTKVFWDATPEDKKIFVADPARGSRHNRGAAVDLSLFDLKTGVIVKMPSEYDEMTERAHINYDCATPESKRLREILRAAMAAEGFNVYEPEWWHYDYKDWKEYPILNVKFSDIGKSVNSKW
jgi:D-alanyl-D-alanine dipeptidase